MLPFLLHRCIQLDNCVCILVPIRVEVHITWIMIQCVGVYIWALVYAISHTYICMLFGFFDPQGTTLNPEPQALNLKPKPKPQTLNLKPRTASSFVMQVDTCWKRDSGVAGFDRHPKNGRVCFPILKDTFSPHIPGLAIRVRAAIEPLIYPQGSSYLNNGF